jgi:hypothetical protein
MRQVSFGYRLPGESPDDYLQRALRQLEEASLEDAMQIADGFELGEFTETHTLNPTTATTADVANFLATFISDLQKRGPNRVE